MPSTAVRGTTGVTSILAIDDLRDIAVSMASQSLISKKKRGPAPTGQGTPVLVRMQPLLLTALASWAAEKGNAGLSRPETVRRALMEHLKNMGYYIQGSK